MRWLVLASALLLLPVACKKKPVDPPAPAPTGAPKVGHAKVKFGSGPGEPASAAGSAGAGSAAVVASATVDAGTPDAGSDDGKPAYRDDDGRVHGPGGPVFQGEGVTCDAAHDHCLRKSVWFAVGNIVSGKLYRAMPVFAFEGKWYSWRGVEDDDGGKLLQTKVAGTAPIAAGTAVVWFSSETDDTKWTNVEYEALTSSRWEAGIVESGTSNGKIRVAGWGDVPQDTVRLITQQKSF